MQALKNLVKRATSARAAQAWNVESFWSGTNWWTSPACLAYYNHAVCGEALPSASEGCRRRLAKALEASSLKPVLDRGISVGCGTGGKEMSLLIDGLVKHFDLWEIAPNIAEAGMSDAKKKGVEDRVTYRIGDAFADTPLGTYDLVYWDHSLHHMSDVDAALKWSVDVLKPGGFVMINDYFGPNRLQFTRAEVDLANDFRRRHGLHGRSKYATPISYVQQWKRDPSEAPQSELISAALERRLPGSRLEPIGGLLLNLLGGVVVPLSRGQDNELIAAMIAEDRELRDKGIFHFAFVLWRKPQA